MLLLQQPSSSTVHLHRNSGVASMRSPDSIKAVRTPQALHFALGHTTQEKLALCHAAEGHKHIPGARTSICPGPTAGPPMMAPGGIPSMPPKPLPVRGGPAPRLPFQPPWPLPSKPSAPPSQPPAGTTACQCHIAMPFSMPPTNAGHLTPQ